MKLAWVATVLMVFCTQVNAQSDVCPPKVAPNGFDFYLPCVPMPNIHLELADQIYFDSSSTELQASARKVLEKQADYLRANPGLKIELVGFADMRGAPSALERIELGGNRAAAVRAYFIAKGIDAERINVEGSGDLPLIPKSLDARTLAAMRFVYAKGVEK